MVLLVSIDLFGHFWLVMKNLRVIYTAVLALLEVHKPLYNSLLVLITFVSLEINAQGGFQAGTLFTQDHGNNCNGLEGDCCLAPDLQWFNKVLNATCDYIELRVCADC